MKTSAGLLSDPKVWALLSKIQEQQIAHPIPLDQLNLNLRKAQFPAQVANAITGQLELREHAYAKFGESARHMLFTREGLEQATRLRVALLHAKRIVDAGQQGVADLGCGIGTESLAAATVGLRTLSIDSSADAVACAAANLRDFPDAQVLLGNLEYLTSGDLTELGIDTIFLDPARRGPAGRISNPEKWSPPWSTVMSVAQWPQEMGVKVAPGIDYSLIPSDYHAQWTSVDGDLVECCLWSSGLSPEGPGRSAVRLDAEGIHHLVELDGTDPTAPPRQGPVGDIGKYLYEPDAAAIRSGLVARLAELTATHLISPRIAYLSSDTRASSPFLTGFRVVAVTALRVKTIKKALSQANAGPVEVKKRGASIDTTALQRSLSGKGPNPMVVFATRIKNDHRAIIAIRESND